jgi:AcrR family transcriptional regulator
VARTRQQLQKALVSLLAEKPYARITVQDILERANVGRSTFYAHYQDKQDLLLRGVAGFHRAGEQPPAEQSPQAAGEGRLQTIQTRSMFAHAAANAALRQAMFPPAQENVLQETASAVLRANVRSQLEELLPPGQAPAVPLEAITAYVSGGLMGLVKWWFDAGRPQSPEEMDALFQQVGMPGVRQALGSGEPGPAAGG